MINTVFDEVTDLNIDLCESKPSYHSTTMACVFSLQLYFNFNLEKQIYFENFTNTNYQQTFSQSGIKEMCIS